MSGFQILLLRPGKGQWPLTRGASPSLSAFVRIVAEGIETDRQQDFLTRLGCDSLQGYLLGHPLPADRFMTDISRTEQQKEVG